MSNTVAHAAIPQAAAVTTHPSPCRENAWPIGQSLQNRGCDGCPGESTPNQFAAYCVDPERGEAARIRGGPKRRSPLRPIASPSHTTRLGRTRASRRSIASPRPVASTPASAAARGLRKRFCRFAKSLTAMNADLSWACQRLLFCTGLDFQFDQRDTGLARIAVCRLRRFRDLKLDAIDRLLQTENHAPRLRILVPGPTRIRSPAATGPAAHLDGLIDIGAVGRSFYDQLEFFRQRILEGDNGLRTIRPATELLGVRDTLGRCDEIRISRLCKGNTFFQRGAVTWRRRRSRSRLRRRCRDG